MDGIELEGKIRQAGARKAGPSSRGGLGMRAKFILSVMVLFLAGGLLWAQFWKEYSDGEKKTVGEAYWLAGRQYEAVGKVEKGREYEAAAKVIYPQLDPAAITDVSQASAAELLAQGRATPIGGGAAAVPTGALNSFFLRFVSSLVEDDADGAAAFLDGSLYVTKDSAELTREEARDKLAAFFAANPLKGTEPSALYDLESIVISREGPAMTKAWGESYTLSVAAGKDLSSASELWDMKQQFFIHRAEGAWHIFAYGQNPPPLTWAPQSSGPAAEKPPAVPVEVAETKAVTDAWNGFLAALLGKDAVAATDRMTDPVRFLRLGQDVTRVELRTSMQGWFENPNFPSAGPAEVVDTDSIFVEPAASPVAAVPGTVYVLNVKATADLSSSIPIWGTWQRYYFTKDGDEWKIFALIM
jgi:hypothetical protein